MGAHVHTHTHTHTHIHTHTHMRAHTHTSRGQGGICRHAHTHTHKHANIHTYTHICTHIYSHTNTHPHAHTHTHLEGRAVFVGVPHGEHVGAKFISLLPYLQHASVQSMGWLRLAGSLKLQVSFAKELYKRDDILRKRLTIFKEPTDRSHHIVEGEGVCCE